MRQRIMLRGQKDSRKLNCKVPGLQAAKPFNLKPAQAAKTESDSIAEALFTADYAVRT
jgi:hypothetical protein